MIEHFKVITRAEFVLQCVFLGYACLSICTQNQMGLFSFRFRLRRASYGFVLTYFFVEWDWGTTHKHANNIFVCRLIWTSRNAMLNKFILIIFHWKFQSTNCYEHKSVISMLVHLIYLTINLEDESDIYTNFCRFKWINRIGGLGNICVSIWMNIPNTQYNQHTHDIRSKINDGHTSYDVHSNLIKYFNRFSYAQWAKHIVNIIFDSLSVCDRVEWNRKFDEVL